MGEARRRAREIADLKRTPAGEPPTPWSKSPVLAVFDQTWMILNSEFQAAIDAVQARPVTAEAAVGTIKELARLALWAERSGVKEVVAQNWFAYQQRCLWDRAQELKPPPSPLPTAPVRVLASSRGKKG